MDRTISNKIQFFLSEMPLCCGVLGGVHQERIPFSPRYVRNSLKRYSPPQSDQKILILFLICFSTLLQNYLNISNDSNLYFIEQTYPYLDRSSVNIMKQLYPPLAHVLMGPYISVCIRPSTSLAHSPIPVKGDLVIFPSKQDSQIGNDL